jgi:carboxyl-terminal processing protease
MADKQTGYIRLSRFAATTNEEFETALNKLRKEGMKNLILDLQSNGGGYLNVACMLADQFLDKDKIIVYTQGDKARRQDALATEKGLFQTGKLVILVDQFSASASEIVSGAIQDWDRGVIIGRRTFGKGLVQRAIDLPDSSLIRLTVARYYTPSGRNIQKPYEKGNKEEYYKDFENRYENGEMISADSIHFPDSLKYNTLVSNRIVYGGGGIMPDVFIPADSSTVYHRRIVNSGVLNRFTINYVQTHRPKLKSKYPNINKFIEKFTVDDDILGELTTAATEAKIELDEEQFEKSKSLLQVQVKALIANDLFEKGEYYQVINEINNSYKEALKIINDDKLYSEVLKLK